MAGKIQSKGNVGSYRGYIATTPPHTIQGQCWFLSWLHCYYTTTYNPRAMLVLIVATLLLHHHIQSKGNVGSYRGYIATTPPHTIQGQCWFLSWLRCYYTTTYNPRAMLVLIVATLLLHHHQCSL